MRACAKVTPTSTSTARASRRSGTGEWRGRSDLGGRVVVGFSVASREEVDRLFAELTAAGHEGLQPPWDAFWGARYAIVEDPDGIAVGLMSPISPERRAPPPAV